MAGRPDRPGTVKGIRVGRLDTIGRIAHELGRLYRAAGFGDVDPADAARMASILNVARQCLADAAIESQVAELEQRMAAVERPGSPLGRGEQLGVAWGWRERDGDRAKH